MMRGCQETLNPRSCTLYLSFGLMLSYVRMQLREVWRWWCMTR
jgi:hypothetical protein